MKNTNLGRPSYLLDAPRLKRVEKWIIGGVFPFVAAQAEGISKPTFFRWLEDAGHADLKLQEGLDLTDYEVRCRDFRDRVRLAEAKAEAAMTVEARAKARAQVTATGSVALLERRFPANWRYQSVTEITGPEGGAIRVETMSDEEIETRLKRLADIAMEAGR